ncbi:zinc transporter 1 [Aureobasidium melanogenum CBS 110374]|uniref:Zinc transporter 1 n=1 Tax=Aureobasidium melanogenum (strain CBS 110374) TaxID=1043003 RepID=A0A074VJD5_AURM1|nr:zinc transporter 1 [Aureobasidium melanogenum CBS 110374]KEQ57722.1 zinc transporter 1 [Aureobasidium melanogenum CBS 110374]
MARSLTKAQKLSLIIAISFSFFLAEIAIGFYTRSLALVADAFHYLNDLVGFVVQLVAFKASERDKAPPSLSFGWQRANLLGGFFNGVFLLALGVSIFLQAIERFIAIQEISNPRLVLIIGCIGFALNVLSVTILHEHDHGDEQPTETSPLVDTSDPQSRTAEASSAYPGSEYARVGANIMLHDQMNRPHEDHRHVVSPNNNKSKEHDLGLMGILIHVAGDAANNLGVILAGAIIWKTTSPGRFYVDPAVSMAISFMIFGSAVPFVKKSGLILLQSVPSGVSPVDVTHDMEKISGVQAVHELHIWRLNQQKSIASAHIVIDHSTDFMAVANTINECLHAYGIHSATLQPEVIPNPSTREDLSSPTLASAVSCLLGCQSSTNCLQVGCCG